MITRERTILRSLAASAAAALLFFAAVSTMAQEPPKAPPAQPAKPAAKAAQPSTPGPEPLEIAVYHLAHAEVGELLPLLSPLMPGEVKLGGDTRTNSILAQGPAEPLGVLKALIAKFDVPAAKGKRQNIELEIIWLAEGLSAKDSPHGPAAPAPPDDWKDFVNHVENSWRVKDLRQVARMNVTTLAGSEFKASCSPVFDGNPTLWTATGTLTMPSRDVANLKLKLCVTAAQDTPRPGSPPAAERNPKLVDLDLTIASEAGTFTVLGLAPTGKITSIFAITYSRY